MKTAGALSLIRSLLLAAAAVIATVAAREARATLPVPASVTCTAASGPCTKIHDATGPGFVGRGSTNVGVLGQSTTQFGINVSSDHFHGACGDSTTGNGATGSTVGGLGVWGIGKKSVGVWGDSPMYGVYGNGRTGIEGVALVGSGWGVSGVASGAGGHAVDAACTGSCTGSSGGNAAVFAGNVSIAGMGANGGLTITVGTGAKPGGGVWGTSSDRRVKKDVKPFALGLDELLRVRPVRYRYNGLGGTTDDGKEYVGVLAQELEAIVPFMVTSRRAKLHPGDAAETDIKQINGTAFTYMLIEAVKTQHQVIADQDVQIAKLEPGGRPMTSSILSPSAATGLGLDLLVVALVLTIRRARARKHLAVKGGSL